jgi:hypothetical protein
LHHYMKVQGQHQASSHFNSAHIGNQILHVAVIILNEVCVIYDRFSWSRTAESLTVCTSVLVEAELLKVWLCAPLDYIAFPPPIHKRRSRFWAIIISQQCLGY